MMGSTFSSPALSTAISTAVLCFTLLIFYALHGWSTHTMNDTFDSLEAKYILWLKTFTAADAGQQAFCERALSHGIGKSQFSQDMYIFFNFFKYWPLQGRLGFYVDSGANDAEEYSNTFFFDKCLGWKGLCIEPQPQYHEALQSKRSCTLVKNCIASKSMMASISGGGTGAKIEIDVAGATVKCLPLTSMLPRTQIDIDVWSLDIEGGEIDVLQSLNFTALNIRTLLVEDFWLSSRELDYILTTRGFVKYQQLEIDSLFTPRRFSDSKVKWFPAKFEPDWATSKAYRKSVNQSSLDC